jgi:hypothetical protein
VNIAGSLTFTGIRPGLPQVTQTFQFTPQSGAPTYTRFSFNADFADIAVLQFPVQGAVRGDTPVYPRVGGHLSESAACWICGSWGTCRMKRQLSGGFHEGRWFVERGRTKNRSELSN